jgi:antitoxin MazE
LGYLSASNHRLARTQKIAINSEKETPTKTSRIPKLFAAEAGLEQSEVDVAVSDGTPAITPSPTPALSDLLSQVTDDNLHGEADSGSPLGREAW